MPIERWSWGQQIKASMPINVLVAELKRRCKYSQNKFLYVKGEMLPISASDLWCFLLDGYRLSCRLNSDKISLKNDTFSIAYWRIAKLI